MTPPPSALDAEIERWIDAFRGPLIGQIASWGADWTAAEELAMDTFAEAWLSRDRFRHAKASIETIGPWLRGIAFHLLQAQRRRARRWPGPLPEAEPVAPTVTIDPRRELLRLAFVELTPEQQEILRMHYLDPTTAREIAALLGTTTKAVEHRLARARTALQRATQRFERSEEVR